MPKVPTRKELDKKDQPTTDQKTENINQDQAPQNQDQQNTNATVTDGDGNTTPSNVNDQGQSAPDAPTGQGDDIQASNPTTEAEQTREKEDPTKTVPVGGADATADHTADSRTNGTENTHPQSPVHEGDISESDQKKIVEEFNAPGAQVASIAERFKITSERVIQIVDEHNKVPTEDRLYG